MRATRHCQYCQQTLQGRSDKKFCDVHCRSAFQYEKSKSEAANFYDKVDRVLKKNRKILRTFNKAGTVTISAQLLSEQGFNPLFYTHCCQDENQKTFYFVYDQGFRRKDPRDTDQYILIPWASFSESLEHKTLTNSSSKDVIVTKAIKEKKTQNGKIQQTKKGQPSGQPFL